jgi:hypothetical protein
MRWGERRRLRDIGVSRVLSIRRVMSEDGEDVLLTGHDAKAKPVQGWWRRIAAKIEWHYTPEHGSWLNIAECELSVLKRQCLKRRMPDIETVTTELAAWQQHRNVTPATIDWRFTTDDARIKLKRLYPIVNVQHPA